MSVARRLAAVAAAMLVVGPASGAPGLPGACEIAGAEPVPYDRLPRPILAAIRERYAGIVPPGAPFNPTDVVRRGEAGRRVVAAWRRGDRWGVATERGGRGYSNPVLAADLPAGAARVRWSTETVASRFTLCATVAGLLGQAPE